MDMLDKYLVKEFIGDNVRFVCTGWRQFLGFKSQYAKNFLWSSLLLSITGRGTTFMTWRTSLFVWEDREESAVWMSWHGD